MNASRFSSPLKYIRLLLPGVCFLLAVHSLSAQITTGFFPLGPNSSIRGLSVPADTVFWLSGSHGWIGHTTQEGKKISWTQAEGYEALDFRSVWAFDGQHALIANAGAPAKILKTDNGGKSWRETYSNSDTLAFLDGLAFWDEKHGIIAGDPMAGHFLILLTSDGGETWQKADSAPPAFQGEACFAASGTCVQTGVQGNVWIGTGGSHARLLHSADFGKNWEEADVPFIQGKASQGIFSVCFSDAKNGIIIGGDYVQDTLCSNSCLYTRDGGKTWSHPQKAPQAFCSCVASLGDSRFIACGAGGSYLSIDGGKTWKLLNKATMFTVMKSRRGKRVLLSGAKGKVMEWKE